MNVEIRKCIICNADNYEDFFVFSKEYTDLIENDEIERRKLNQEHGPQVIVKCKECSCKYVRNVVKGISQNSNETHNFESNRSRQMIVEQSTDFFNKKINEKFFENRLDKLRLLESLCNKNLDQISILDYGCGLGDYPKLAEILGFKKIVAYDPMYTDEHQKSFKESGFNNILSINSISQLSEDAKFDMIICTAVIEHAISPRKMFNDLEKLSKSNTLILFSNPVMNIEKDLPSMKKLITSKSDDIKSKRYLHYHLGHINYMLGKQINTLTNDYGFRILPIYPNNSNEGFMVKLKKIYVQFFPQSTRTEYVLKKI